MPLYEYECRKCEKVHEIMQKFSDAPMETCPECGGPVKKLISMSSFSLKGSGWYTTDYKRAGKPGGTPAPDAKAASSDAKSSSTTLGTPSTSTPSSNSSGDSAASATPAANTDSKKSTDFKASSPKQI